MTGMFSPLSGQGPSAPSIAAPITVEKMCLTSMGYGQIEKMTTLRTAKKCFSRSIISTSTIKKSFMTTGIATTTQTGPSSNMN